MKVFCLILVDFLSCRTLGSVESTWDGEGNVGELDSRGAGGSEREGELLGGDADPTL